MREPVKAIYIDDDPRMASLLPRVLALAGIDVSAVCPSAEALLAMKYTPAYAAAEIFVTDVQLPGMTGVELARTLRAEGERRPILVVSAWSETKAWGLAKMNVAYLQKPYEFEALENTIQKLVQASKAA